MAGFHRADPRDQIAIRELGRRTISATVGLVLVFALRALLVPDANGPSLVVLLPIFAALLAVRIAAHHACLTAPARTRSWVLLGLGAIGSNLLWGVVVACATTDPDPGLSGVAHAFILCAFGVGTVTNGAPSARFQRAALSALMVPPIAAACFGRGVPAFAALEAVFFLFCLVMGGLQTRSFWEMVAANEQLRTHAAEQQRAHDELRAEVGRRLQVEVELRQAQKLEAVGRLAAGIAHEINTPIQFVTDSCTFLSDGVRELAGALADYRVLVEDLVADRTRTAEALVRAGRIDEERDLGYLRENLTEAATRALDGLSRVARIVQATKEFARPAGTKTLANLNAALENTLVICGAETARVAEVVTELGLLPLARCDVGEINQVFVNIIVNAAQAIAEVVDGTVARGRISIKTSTTGDGWIQIEIADTGGGIHPTIVDKIFEPFFTTKEVGKGTGQGLAIARAIVVRHGGALDVRSQVGAGTTFTIALPT